MSNPDALNFVRKAFKAIPFDDESPVDATESVEVGSLDELPPEMSQPNAPLIFWVGHNGATIEEGDIRRYIITENFRVVMSAKKAKQERFSAVISRLIQWTYTNVARSRIEGTGIYLMSPGAIEPKSSVLQVDRAGRAIVEAAVTVGYELEF